MKIKLLTTFLALFGFGKADASITAQASFYAHAHHGKIMANGRPFNMYALTLATWDYPLGTYVNIEYTASSGRIRSVVAQVTDRGPAKRLVAQGRRFDLSYATFKKLENPRIGVIQVRVTPIQNGNPSQKAR
jgi:rare lipoprotein A